MKDLKFSKIHKNIIFLKFYQNFEVTFNIDLVEQINKWLALQAWILLNFDRKITTAFLVINECITFKKNLENYSNVNIFLASN